MSNSRVVKFRAWGHLAKEDDYRMFFNVSLAWSFNAMMPYTLNDQMICDHSLMQYTGLEDKSGKEIYEGDIVKTTYTNHDHNGEIYFQPTRLKWSVKHSPFSNQGLFVYSRHDYSVEIIGNIHENRELLEK